jgi:hypothetical protein
MPKYSNKRIPDEWLLLALEQASCLHCRDEVVQEIVGKACCDLSVRSRDQKHRLYAKTRKPARIYLEDQHLLQHLVFWHSETHEKTQETYAPSSINERDMITRYLAFIVRKTLKRNSLYGVTGVCRFICRYELKDVREIYDALLDEPDRYKTDDDFRSNRKRMRDMIFKRFSKYLCMEETHNGQEKHFQLRDNQNDLSLLQLIKGSLDAFKPWYTQCLPASFMPHEEKRGIFSHHDEHVCEIERLHTLIHPDCFKTLIESLGFDVPDTRLGIPRFLYVSSIDETPFGAGSASSSASSGRGNNDSSNASANRLKLEVLRGMLIEQAEKLKSFVPEGVLTVKIDGEDVASLNLDTTNRVEFTVDSEEAELIEIVAQSKRLVLAVHPLDDEIWQTRNRRHSYIVRHQSGAKIKFILRRLSNADTGNGQLLVSVIYKETNLARSLTFLWRRMGSRFSSRKQMIENTGESLLPSKLLAPIMAIRNLSLLWLMALLVIISLASASLLPLLQYFPSPVFVATNKEPDSNNAVPGEAEAKGETTPVESKKATPRQIISRPYRPKKLGGKPNNPILNNSITKNDPTSSTPEMPDNLIPNDPPAWCLAF